MPKKPKQEWRCSGCHSVHTGHLVTNNPFDKTQMIWACPTCKEVFGHTEQALCDEEGCTLISSTGWPSEDGYRNTCGQHMKRVL